MPPKKGSKQVHTGKSVPVKIGADLMERLKPHARRMGVSRASLLSEIIQVRCLETVEEISDEQPSEDGSVLDGTASEET